MEFLREATIKEVLKWVELGSHELDNLYYEKGFSIKKVGMGESFDITELKRIKWFLREVKELNQ